MSKLSNKAKLPNNWQKVTALVPLALVSGAWTASLAVTGATAADNPTGQLPGGQSLPAEAIEAPASFSVPGEIAPAVPRGQAKQIASSVSTNGIPAAALAAYQRAAQVMDGAKPGCNLTWQLLAAIGRVESDHGRYGGNVLTNKGLSEPGIYGIPLNGRNNTARIVDTDAGQYDNDRTFDRAVGPMQFIPSTWSVVGVDGDGDGKRNPQDIDDAALASGVYLCSGGDDLSTPAGARNAVFRYNNSNAYVDLVLSIADAYGKGNYISMPNGSYSAATFTPDYDDSVFNASIRGQKVDQDVSASGPREVGNPTPTPAPGSPSPSPTDGGSADGGEDGATDGITDVPGAVTDTLSAVEQATAYCVATLSESQLNALGGVNACAEAYLSGGASAVQGLVASLGGLLGGVTGR